MYYALIDNHGDANIIYEPFALSLKEFLLDYIEFNEKNYPEEKFSLLEITNIIIIRGDYRLQTIDKVINSFSLYYYLCNNPVPKISREIASCYIDKWKDKTIPLFMKDLIFKLDKISNENSDEYV